MCARDGLSADEFFPDRPDAADSFGCNGETGAAPRRRIVLWQSRDAVHCSIVGTCASVEDLRRLAAKLGINISDTVADYDIHGHFVKEVTRETPFARAFQKLLDQRFEGALRRVARTRGTEALLALWAEMRDRGQIAGAYWAFMTHGHVPAEVRATIFGEVHMLSHLAGASHRRQSVEASALRDRLTEANERARRVEAGLKEAVAERDREIEGLRAEIARLRGRQEARPLAEPPAAARRVKDRTEKLKRALLSARVRARQAEEEVRHLRKRLAPVRPTGGHEAPSMEAASSNADERPLAGRAVLYVGGRHGHLDRLRTIAEEFEAIFIHHDGGVEDAPQRLDSLLPSVDCVFCPIDCVSHDACLRAKRACQRLNKPFVPLRSTGQTTFRSALSRMARTAPSGTDRAGANAIRQ